jgi:hypothetical protein
MKKILFFIAFLGLIFVIGYKKSTIMYYLSEPLTTSGAGRQTFCGTHSHRIARPNGVFRAYAEQNQAIVKPKKRKNYSRTSTK